MKMRTRVLTPIARAVVARPWLVLLLAAAVGGAAAWAGAHLKLKVGRTSLLSEDDPALVQYKAFVEEFGGLNAVFVIAAAPPDALVPFVRQAGPAIEKMPRHVRSATWRIDVAHHEAQGLWLQSPEQLERVYMDLLDAQPALRAMLGAPSIATCLAAIAEQMGDPEATPRETPEVVEDVRNVRHAVGAIPQALDRARTAPLTVLPGLRKGRPSLEKLHLDEHGLLAARDFGSRLIVIQPSPPLSNDKLTRAFLADFESAIAPAKQRYPSVEVHLAGGPLRDLEEGTTVNKDLTLTSLVSAVSVAIVLFFAYRSFALVVILMTTLVFCITLTVGASYALIGHLNLVSAVFAAILFGLGDDFCTYLILDAVEHSGEGSAAAVAGAVVRVGASVLTAAITIAIAFYSLGLHELVAFRELGAIAGTGILLTYAAVITILPALVTLYLRRHEGEKLHIDAEPGGTATRPGAFGRLLLRLSRWPRAVLAIALVAWIALLPLALGNRFEFDVRQLVPAGEAARTEQMLLDRFGISSEFTVILSKTVADVHRVHSEMEKSPAVARVDSLARFMSADPEKSRPGVRKLRTWFSEMPALATGAPATSVRALVDALTDLKAASARPRQLANMSESRELHAEVDGLERDIEAALAALAPHVNAPGPPGALPELDRTLAAELSAWWDFMNRATSAAPYTLATLPAELKNRYVGKKGALATYVTPRSDLSLEEDAIAFHDATTAVSSDATGVPVLVYRAMSTIKAGWLRAAGWLFLAIVMMVVIDFGSFRLATLALVPLLWGVTGMAAALTLAGLRWNAVSSISLPILLGVGVDYGVNFLHRYVEEGDLEQALGHGGPAIGWAALTTALGFGSLALAHHRGLGSFGLTLLFGILFSVTGALVIVPACVRLMGKK